MTNIEALATSVTELDGKISALVVKHNRAMDTLDGIKVLVDGHLDLGLKIRAIRALLDVFNRPFETPDPITVEECPACGQVAELSDKPNGSMTFAAPVCYDCRNPEREPNSQAERDGDA